MWENCKKFYMEESTKFDDDRENEQSQRPSPQKTGLGLGAKEND